MKAPLMAYFISISDTSTSTKKIRMKLQAGKYKTVRRFI